MRVEKRTQRQHGRVTHKAGCFSRAKHQPGGAVRHAQQKAKARGIKQIPQRKLYGDAANHSPHQPFQKRTLFFMAHRVLDIFDRAADLHLTRLHGKLAHRQPLAADG